MKRKALSLLLHPIKNRLVPKDLLSESLGRFFESVFTLLQSFPQIRFNIVIPAYQLECLDPLLIAKLRDFCKKNLIEVVCTGYTEPFLSLSPPELTVRNIRLGLAVIEELTGKTARGFLPPFSNWEPSFIAHLRSMGFRYTLLSSELLSDDNRTACGYWVAEHAGSTIGLLGATMVKYTHSSKEFFEWLQKLFGTRSGSQVEEAFVTLHYLFPLCTEKFEETLSYLKFTVEEIDKHLLTYQPVCLSDFLGGLSPLGLQYIPSSLQIDRIGAPDTHFINYLFSFDQIGFMQRKLLDIYDRLVEVSGSKQLAAMHLERDLFYAQDINRFLPGKDAGFQIGADRRSTYSRLIAVDRELHAQKKSGGGHVRIADFLRNGGNTIILSNRNLKIFIDPHHGGQIIGFDFRQRLLNLCSVYNPQRHRQPDIIVSNFSRTWFRDRILSDSGDRLPNEKNITEDDADFHSSDFDHRIRRTASGINVSLTHNGCFSGPEKPYPLQLEKLFGLYRESAQMSFVYQLSNPSLMTYSFTFSTELDISLPGVMYDRVRLIAGKDSYDNPGHRLIYIPSVSVWSIVDRVGGVRIQMHTQKPLNLWCLPSDPEKGCLDGLRIILSLPVVLEPSAQSKIIGKILCKMIKKNFPEEDQDAL